MRSQKTTQQEVRLYKALKKRGLDCSFHYDDGHKTVDMAILDSGIYIEVDGLYHYLRPEQLVTDLKRERYSSKAGYSTLHFLNSIIDEHLDSVADAICKIARANKNKKIINHNS